MRYIRGMTGAIKKIPEPITESDEVPGLLRHIIDEQHDANQQRAKLTAEIAELRMRVEGSLQAIAQFGQASGEQWHQVADQLAQIMFVVEEAKPLLESPMAGWLRARQRRPTAAPGG